MIPLRFCPQTILFPVVNVPTMPSPESHFPNRTPRSDGRYMPYTSSQSTLSQNSHGSFDENTPLSFFQPSPPSHNHQREGDTSDYGTDFSSSRRDAYGPLQPCSHATFGANECPTTPGAHLITKLGGTLGLDERRLTSAHEFNHVSLLVTLPWRN